MPYWESIWTERFGSLPFTIHCPGSAPHGALNRRGSCTRKERQRTGPCFPIRSDHNPRAPNVPNTTMRTATMFCTWCSVRGDPCRSQSIHYHGHRFGGSTPQSTIRRTWTCCHRHPEQHWAHTSRSFHPCDSMLSEVHTVR